MRLGSHDEPERADPKTAGVRQRNPDSCQLILEPLGASGNGKREYQRLVEVRPARRQIAQTSVSAFERRGLRQFDAPAAV